MCTKRVRTPTDRTRAVRTLSRGEKINYTTYTRVCDRAAALALAQSGLAGPLVQIEKSRSPNLPARFADARVIPFYPSCHIGSLTFRRYGSTRGTRGHGGDKSANVNTVISTVVATVDRGITKKRVEKGERIERTREEEREIHLERKTRTVMEVLLAEIELDLVQSIKWRQIAGVAGGKEGLLQEEKEEGQREREGKCHLGGGRVKRDRSSRQVGRKGDEAAETSQIKDAVTVNS